MRLLTIGLIAATALSVDLASKLLIESLIAPYSSIAVFSNFNLVHIYNRGTSFGLLQLEASYGPYILSLLALGIVVALAVWAYRTHSAFQRCALALIIGGAASNAADRLDDGAVTDFLDLYIGIYHWPAFNLADIAIVCGVAAMVLAPHFLRWSKSKKSSTS